MLKNNIYNKDRIYFVRFYPIFIETEFIII